MGQHDVVAITVAESGRLACVSVVATAYSRARAVQCPHRLERHVTIVPDAEDHVAPCAERHSQHQTQQTG